LYLERAEVVELVTLSDLERVVGAVCERSSWSPDELATSCSSGQGADGLEVA